MGCKWINRWSITSSLSLTIGRSISQAREDAGILGGGMIVAKQRASSK
jgi:hypothetical protein